MKDINEIVTSKMNSMFKDGVVEEMIKKNIEEVIKKSIENAFRSYGDFAKTLERKISDSIQVSASKLEIPAYNKFIAEIVEDRFIKILGENATSHLNEMISKIIEPIKKEEKISTLLEQIEELWSDEARESGKEKIIIKTDMNDEETALHVTFCHPQYDFYNVRVAFYNFKLHGDKGWHIGYINEGANILSGKILNTAKTSMNDLGKLLFKYYAMGTLFEMDEEIENIYVCD